MKKHIALKVILVFILIHVALIAQVSSTSKLLWDQTANDLPEAQSFTYRYYADGSTSGIAFSNVTCTGTANPFVCQVNFPTFSIGPHTLQLTAANSTGESIKSNPFSFTFGSAVVPSNPTNIRYIR